MFRFTIRDLLWLMVVVALGVAWWIDHGRQATAIRIWKDRVGDVNHVLLQETGSVMEWGEPEPGNGLD